MICTLIPDDVIPELPITPKSDALWVLASGYAVAFGRIDPNCDLGMVAPRMLGPEVRECYVEGVGFITALGIQKDNTGTALARTLAVGRAVGGLRQGAIEMTPRQEAVLDLAVEQVLAPAMARVSMSFVAVMSGAGIPLEAIMTELMLSGEIERSYRLLRLEGYAGQMRYHSRSHPHQGHWALLLFNQPLLAWTLNVWVAGWRRTSAGDLCAGTVQNISRVTVFSP